MYIVAFHHYFTVSLRTVNTGTPSGQIHHKNTDINLPCQRGKTLENYLTIKHKVIWKVSDEYNKLEFVSVIHMNI